MRGHIIRTLIDMAKERVPVGDQTQKETFEIASNLGGGTARDLQLLWQSVIERVAQQTGVDITNRVHWAGKLGR